MKYAKIYKIEETNEKKEMYDLEVPLNQNFILANNILSHNSGKTRALKLITYLSYNGELMNNISESVLFRTAENHTIGLDEFEHVGSKEKSALRELLNAAYKRGAVVKRAYKIKGKEREGYQIETFNVYCPIIMANIWGMDEVTGDRCITLIIDKSNKKEITRKIEDFETNQEINEIKVVLGSVMPFGRDRGDIYKDIIGGWNTYISLKETLPNTTSTITLQNTINTTFFKKVEQTSLEGRHLELFFPLFILADAIGFLNEFIPIAEQIIKEKKEEDLMEGRDISLLEFISTYEETRDFILLKGLTAKFKEIEEEDWINSKWMGRALKRLSLIKFKRRVKGIREVVIDFDKAREKIKMFGITNEPKIENDTLSRPKGWSI